MLVEVERGQGNCISGSLGMHSPRHSNDHFCELLQRQVFVVATDLCNHGYRFIPTLGLPVLCSGRVGACSHISFHIRSLSPSKGGADAGRVRHVCAVSSGAAGLCISGARAVVCSLAAEMWGPEAHDACRCCVCQEPAGRRSISTVCMHNRRKSGG